MVAFVANTNVLDLIGLKSEVEDTFLDDADVNFTIKTKAGVEVIGTTWPIDMEYIATSNGNYRGIIPASVALVNKGHYVAFIEATAGAERIGHWEFSFRAVTRTGNTADT